MLIPKSVKQIVAEHHEACDGSGFPRGIKDSKIYTLAKIVFLADTFVHIMTEKELKPIEALKEILMDPDVSYKYNGLIIENFTKVFIDPDKIKRETSVLSKSKLVNRAS